MNISEDMSPLAAPPPGTLRLIKGIPNPKGACSSSGLYLLVGDATRGPIHEILSENGLGFPEADPSSDRFPFLLKIFHFNDLHNHLVEITHGRSFSVFSKIARKIRQIRLDCQADPRTAALLMSGGDDLIGSVFDELLDGGEDSDGLHAAYQLYSAAGVDLGVLGNHDLDYGTRILGQAMQRDARFPLLSANLIVSSGMAEHYYPSALIVTKGIRIGVVGLTTSAESVRWRESDFKIADPIEVAHNILPALKPYCDVLVLLTHLGYSLSTPTAITQGAGDVELARSLPYGFVHLIIGAHTHRVINENGLSGDNIVNGIPIVQAGTMGQYLGEVDITLRPRAVVTHSRLWLTSEILPDEEFELEQVQPLVKKAENVFERPLGLATDQPDLSTESIHNYVAEGESAMANFVTDGIVSRCRQMGERVDFAMIDCAGLSAGLEPGRAFTYGDWFNVMPFANTLRFCDMTGTQLKALLEENAYRINRPDEPNTERGFLQLSREIRYQIILGPERSNARAAEISVSGIPVEEVLTQTFRVAYPNFLRELSRGWEIYAAKELGFSIFHVSELPYSDSDLFLRNQMVAYILQYGGVTEEGGAVRDGRLIVK
jgi:2',3'-cyclic-nucleotide 2'-phosphodiesterase (5'-nucleotidase family)